MTVLDQLHIDQCRRKIMLALERLDHTDATDPHYTLLRVRDELHAALQQIEEIDE